MVGNVCERLPSRLQVLETRPHLKHGFWRWIIGRAGQKDYLVASLLGNLRMTSWRLATC